MIPWLRVPYEHNSADLNPIYLAVSPRRPDAESTQWQAAYRDIYNGTPVVQIRAELTRRSGRVWLYDQEGIRKVKPLI